MAIYNFKRDITLTVIYDNKRYKLPVWPGLSVSQTFDEINKPIKTIHNPTGMFADANIQRASPANFSFAVPINTSGDSKILVELLIDYASISFPAKLKTFDLSITDSDGEIYNIYNCVLERGTFQIVKNEPMLLAVSGSGSKFIKDNVVLGAGHEDFTNTTSFSVPYANSIELDTLNIGAVNALTVEVANSIQWQYSQGLQEILKYPRDAIYPSFAVLESKAITGTIQTYVTSDNKDHLQTWDKDIPLCIKTGNDALNWTLEFDFPSIIFTNRVDFGQDLLMQSYDFRLTNTSEINLSTIVKYNNI